MSKVFSFQSIIIAILLAALAFLVRTNNQIVVQNQKLNSQVLRLNSKLDDVNISTHKIEQRMAELENKLKPKFQGLLAQVE